MQRRKSTNMASEKILSMGSVDRAKKEKENKVRRPSDVSPGPTQSLFLARTLSSASQSTICSLNTVDRFFEPIQHLDEPSAKGRPGESRLSVV
jgi:hypothetical protein